MNKSSYNRDNYCRFCSHDPMTGGQGRRIRGELYCFSCTDGKSDIDILHEKLKRDENRWSFWIERMEVLKIKNSILKHEIHCLERAARKHLQVIDRNEEISKEQKEAIRLAAPVEDSFTSRQRRLEVIRKEHDRRARIEVTFCSEEKSYQANVFRFDGLHETWVLPAWNRNQIRVRIDDAKIKNSRVPWKQIELGQPWVMDVELSPYFIEKTWVPKNLIPFNRSAPTR